jgi:hypothetical protein
VASETVQENHQPLRAVYHVQLGVRRSNVSEDHSSKSVEPTSHKR